MTKAELNARLRQPLSPSKLKKTPIAELEAMVAAEQKPARRTPDRVLVEPAASLDEVKPIRAGTKRHKMVDALARGCTLDELAEATGWRRDVASAAIYTDMRAAGLGVRRDGGVLRLILPEGVAAPRIVPKKAAMASK